MPPLNLPGLAAGAAVSAELLVLERVERSTGAGDPFWVLTLGNFRMVLRSKPEPPPVTTSTKGRRKAAKK